MQSFFAAWTFEPTVLFGLVVSAFLYARGAQYSIERGLARHLRWWRAACFFGGLLVILLALESPIDAQAEQYLWVHMVQHELLTLVAPPLLLLGEPMWPMWRALPLAWRRGLLRWALKQGWPRRVGDGIAHVFRMPVLICVLFLGVFDIWHLPVLYGATLENTTIHALEHAMFLVVGLLFWAQIIPSRPLKPRMNYFKRAAFLGMVALEGNVFGFFFLFATTPIYTHYAQIARTPDMISAVADVHYAGAVMDGADTFILIVVIMALLGLWLQAEEESVKIADAERARQRLAMGAQTGQAGVESTGQAGQATISPLASVSAPTSRPLRLVAQPNPVDA